MADLTDRGQIILGAAFALGVIFIALAVVVNVAIFTENLVTRGGATSDEDALHYRHEVEQNVGAVIDNVNAQSDGASKNQLAAWAMTNISNVIVQGGNQKAGPGESVTSTTSRGHK